MSPSPKPLKIFFHAADAIGHLNACVGMAQSIAKRGHRIIFLVNDAFAGKFTKFGFEEIELKFVKPLKEGETAPKEDPNAPKKNPIKEMAEGLIKSGMLSALSPLEKLKAQDSAPPHFMVQILETLVQFDPQIAEAIQREKPDLFVLDHFLIPPALPQSGVPWVYLFSGNPLFLYKNDKLPPFGAGFPTASDPASWAEFAELQNQRFLKMFITFQEKLNDRLNYHPAESEKAFGMSTGSKYLNIYGYPLELDYIDIVPRPPKLVQVDAYCFEVPEPFKVPEEFAKKSASDKLIYVSLGSMGAVDVDLMKRIVSVLAKAPYKFIVSKGPRADEYELPENCWGEGFLPQTRILPLVDLVITHGGNNTVTETFSFGKPMIVMPLFADQYDNGQRVTEKGYGARLETYAFKEEELLEALDRLLNDKVLGQRLEAASKRIQNSNSKEVVVKQLEQLVQDFKDGKTF